MRVLLVAANREKLPSPVVPLGVLAVAGALRDAHEVRVADLCFEDDPIRALESAVAGFDPELVGIGLRNLHTNAYDGQEPLIQYYADLVAAVRRMTGAPVVLGGGGYSVQPVGLLERIGADYGVVGEGERTFRELVDLLARGADVPRIVTAEAFAPRADGPLRLRKPGLPQPSDLDLLPPPARDLVDPRYYAFDGTDNIQTKRGCAFACAYCDYPDIEGKRVRVRDPQAIADEVLARSRVPGVTHAFLVDSVFNVPPAHALEVCRALIDRGSPLPWVCYGTPAAFDDELVAAMAQAGCQGVEIGSDAGSEQMLRRLRKPFKLREIIETRELFVKHGLLDCHTFVLGWEGETPEEAQETLDFVDRLNPDIAVFFAFMEDRENRTVHRARHRDALLALLAREAPLRAGWVVPELDVRFGRKLTRVVEKQRMRGPSWLHLARQRRARVRGLV